MSVVTGTYASNEQQVFSYLTGTMKLNTAAACGVLANIYHESGFNPNASGDGGTSYGICQWHSTRFTDLKNYCSRQGLSYTSVRGQLAFLNYELSQSYSSLLSTMRSASNTSSGAYNIGYRWCYDFERPANKASESARRGQLAQSSYWNAYKGSSSGSSSGSGGSSSSSSTSTTNYGSLLVKEARKHLGKPYVWGANGPSSFDCSGLVYYCLNQIGRSISDQTAQGYYDTFKSTSKSVNSSNTAAGDLLFYKNTSEIYHIAIANGSGGRIHAKGKAYGVIEESGLGGPTYILRIFSESETYLSGEEGSTWSDSDSSEGSSSYNSFDETAVEDFSALTIVDEYASIAASNLARVEAAGFDYGYLIDLTHSGEFKFYIPDFSESAGANWQDVDIIGRSVTIKAYNNTSSRSIGISLELYAGAGIYDNSTSADIVGDMYKDINFVKSLEYPDYSNPIVRPPSTVQLILGSAVNLVGVVSDVQVEHLKPLDLQNRSMYVKLSFKVTQTAVNPPDYSDIRGGSYATTSTSNISTLSNISTSSSNSNISIFS